MERRDAFSGCHPLVQLVYFALVLVLGMFVMHPACLLASLACAAGYLTVLRGGKALGRLARVLAPMALMAAVVNPAFNHRGVTVLGHFPSGNPLTLESILYGLAAAVLLAAVVLWCTCCSAVMTSARVLYRGGRGAPSLALLLSMVLRFLPRCRAQYQAVREAQMGLSGPPRGGLERARMTGKLASVTVTWALENAVAAAESMKSRGYGLPGRTAYSRYRFDSRDRRVLGWVLLWGGVCLWGWAAGALGWHWFPMVGGAVSPAAGACLVAQLALGLTPVILHAKEARTWKRLRSAI